MSREIRQTAVIDIGSTAIRLLVAESLSDGSWKVLDRAGKPVALGQDSFSKGVISRSAMSQSLEILTSFKELLNGWGINEPDIIVIATSALREARNRDTFVDRIRLKTGFRVSIIEGLEENRLTYIAVNNVLKDLTSTFSDTNSIIIEVGGGSTEIMLLRQGKMVAAHSLKIGTVRVKQQIGASSVSPERVSVFLRENIRTVREALANEFSLDQVQSFVAVGGDARIAAREAGSKKTDTYSIIEAQDFSDFIKSITDLAADELSRDLGIPYTDAEEMSAALEIYRLFMESTSATQLIVPNVSIRDGILLEALSGTDDESRKEFESQILASAESLGRKYHFDQAHAQHVSFLALQLFDQMTEDHGIGKRGRRQLQIAALLHDIGTYVGTSGHHKHSQYLVSNSEIFGLQADDIEIISNVVRYHRKAQPQDSHAEFRTLSRANRMIVMKLSAILRVADALDRGHVQRITSLKLDRSGDTLHLHPAYRGDLSVERYGLRMKGGMFEEVFGVNALLG